MKNSLKKFDNFLSIDRLIGNRLSQFNGFQLKFIIRVGSNLEHPRLFWSYLHHPNSKSYTVSFVGFLNLQETLCQIFRFFLNRIDQLGTIKPVHQASLCGALFLLILGAKSYLFRAHKPQISPKNGLGQILGHVIGFFQPTLGPLGYLVVKERSKCGQLWTLGIKECSWSWGSPRLIGGVDSYESYRYKSCMLLPFSFALVFAFDICNLVLGY